MYERFYGMRERAFELTPDPRFLLLTKRHREALSNLEYGISSRRGLTVLIGEAGTGKTTLLRKALGGTTQDGRQITAVHLTNPALDRGEFIEFLAGRFGIDARSAGSKTRVLQDLEAALVERRAAGQTVVLAIDEAQSLSHELLEEIRLLGNIESDTEKLMPLVLAGQPELADRLNEPGLRQLKQRIALRCTLEPLNIGETAGYIAGRIRLAGSDAGMIFSRDAVIAIYRYSRGIPRVVNVICDNALVSGYALERMPVDSDLVEEVCRDFDLKSASDDVAGAHSRPSDSPAKVHRFTTDARAFSGTLRRAAAQEH